MAKVVAGGTPELPHATGSIYVLSANSERSPVNDHLYACSTRKRKRIFSRKNMESAHGANSRLLCRPWPPNGCTSSEGDITRFKVVKVWSSIFKQIASAKTETGDENNQNISALASKVDIRKLEDHAENDPEAYAYSSALCRVNQDVIEFVLMFKALIKVLHPLLTATQAGNYKGTEGVAALPFNGIILTHSNETDWVQFRNNKNNNVFLYRIYIINGLLPAGVAGHEDLQQTA